MFSHLGEGSFSAWYGYVEMHAFFKVFGGGYMPLIALKVYEVRVDFGVLKFFVS